MISNRRILEISCMHEITAEQLAELIDTTRYSKRVYKKKKEIQEAQAQEGIKCARAHNMNTNFVLKYLSINLKDVERKYEREKMLKTE